MLYLQKLFIMVNVSEFLMKLKVTTANTMNLHSHSNVVISNVTCTIHCGAEPIEKTFDTIEKNVYFFLDLRSISERKRKTTFDYACKIVDKTRLLSFPIQGGKVRSTKDTMLCIKEVVSLILRYPLKPWYIHCLGGYGRSCVMTCIVFV